MASTPAKINDEITTSNEEEGNVNQSQKSVTSNEESKCNNSRSNGSKLAYSEGGKLPSNAPQWALQASQRLQQKRLAQKEEQEAEQKTQDSLSKMSISTTNPPPKGVKRVLLHSCCAPCSGAMVEEMCSSKYIEDVVVFFYNPNIHPKREYEIRKEENKRFCEKLNIPFIDNDYDVSNWYARTSGMEYDPERGRRCTACFDMRMERTALYAHENNFDAIATTNATSRWKDVKQVDDSGRRAAQRYEGMVYLGKEEYNDWQSDEMTLRKYQISAEQRFYKQEYCGCSHSLRDSNEWRKANGIPKIKIGGEEAGLGQRYFTDPLVDAEEENQDVVDEFFRQAEELAEKGGNDLKERKKVLKIYENRRKTEAAAGVDKGGGTIQGLNNW